MKRQLIITGALLLSLVLALIGQYLLPNVTWTRLGGAYFGVAALALVWVLLIEPVGALVGVSDVARPFPSSLPLLPLNLFWRVILIGITGLLAVYAFLRLGENQFTPDGTAAWLAAILCFGGSFAHVPTG